MTKSDLASLRALISAFSQSACPHKSQIALCARRHSDCVLRSPTRARPCAGGDESGTKKRKRQMRKGKRALASETRPGLPPGFSFRFTHPNLYTHAEQNALSGARPGRENNGQGVRLSIAGKASFTVHHRPCGCVQVCVGRIDPELEWQLSTRENQEI